MAGWHNRRYEERGRRETFEENPGKYSLLLGSMNNAGFDNPLDFYEQASTSFQDGFPSYLRTYNCRGGKCLEPKVGGNWSQQQAIRVAEDWYAAVFRIFPPYATTQRDVAPVIALDGWTPVAMTSLRTQSNSSTPNFLSVIGCFAVESEGIKHLADGLERRLSKAKKAVRDGRGSNELLQLLTACVAATRQNNPVERLVDILGRTDSRSYRESKRWARARPDKEQAAVERWHLPLGPKGAFVETEMKEIKNDMEFFLEYLPSVSFGMILDGYPEVVSVAPMQPGGMRVRFGKSGMVEDEDTPGVKLGWLEPAEVGHPMSPKEAGRRLKNMISNLEG